MGRRERPGPSKLGGPCILHIMLSIGVRGEFGDGGRHKDNHRDSRGID